MDLQAYFPFSSDVKPLLPVPADLAKAESSLDQESRLEQLALSMNTWKQVAGGARIFSGLCLGAALGLSETVTWVLGNALKTTSCFAHQHLGIDTEPSFHHDQQSIGAPVVLSSKATKVQTSHFVNPCESKIPYPELNRPAFFCGMVSLILYVGSHYALNQAEKCRLKGLHGCKNMEDVKKQEKHLEKNHRKESQSYRIQQGALSQLERVREDIAKLDEASLKNLFFYEFGLIPSSVQSFQMIGKIREVMIPLIASMKALRIQKKNQGMEAVLDPRQRCRDYQYGQDRIPNQRPTGAVAGLVYRRLALNWLKVQYGLNFQMIATSYLQRDPGQKFLQEWNTLSKCVEMI